MTAAPISFARVMVGTDGSPGAAAAARTAAALAKAFGSELLVVHVSNLPAAMSAGISGLPELADDYLDVIKEHAFAVTRDVLDAAGVAHEDVVVFGPPADSLVEEAKKRDVDCIVIGHTGLSAVERFFMGSVSDRVAHKARCAVVIAPVAAEE